MFFLSLLLDLMLALGGAGAYATPETDSIVDNGAHRTHGHLEGPPLGHTGVGGDSHLHHGQHGHSTTVSGGEHPHDPEARH